MYFRLLVFSVNSEYILHYQSNASAEYVKITTPRNWYIDLGAWKFPVQFVKAIKIPLSILASNDMHNSVKPCLYVTCKYANKYLS